MPGIHQETGAELPGFDHVLQSLTKIFNTFQGERIEREWVGNPGLRLLGELGSEVSLLRWHNIVWLLIILFEPRARLQRFYPIDLTREGNYTMQMDLEYLPFGHRNWVQAQAYISVQGNEVVVKRAA